MHQYKTVAQILLILSIFNLVFAIPVEREIYDAHGDVVVPAVVRNVVVTSKERSQYSEYSDGTPSQSSPPPPPPPDGLSPSHSSPPSPSHGSSPLHESLSPPGGPAGLAVSSHPGETASLPVVPASDQPVPGHSTSTVTSRPYKGAKYNMLDPASHRAPPMSKLTKGGVAGSVLALSGLALTLMAGIIWESSHNNRRRTIGPDCSTAKGSRHPGRALTINRKATSKTKRNAFRRQFEGGESSDCCLRAFTCLTSGRL